jgi:hypothetical protein
VFGGSLGGKVVGLADWPTKGAVISINGKPTTSITNQHGRYQLRGSDMTVEGTETRMNSFTLHAEAEGYHFEPLHVKLTDETTELPELKAKHINLCGKVQILNDNNEAVAPNGRQFIVHVEQ